MGESPEASTLSMAAAAWYGVSGLVTSLVGGWVAGRLSAQRLRNIAALHGLTAWAATTLVVLSLLFGAVSGLVGGVLGAVCGWLGGRMGAPRLHDWA
jgi:hypothetical protein